MPIRTSLSLVLLILLQGTFSTVARAADTSERLVAKANFMMSRGHYAEARQILKSVLTGSPKSTHVLCLLGSTYLNADDNSQALSRGFPVAIKYYQQAVAIDPECGEAYRHLADCANINGDYPEALKMATKAIQAKQPSPTAYRERAVALTSLNRHKEALADIEQLIKYEPNKLEVLLMKGSVLENQGNYQEALSVYRQSEKIKNDDGIKYRQIQCLSKSGQKKEAIAMLDQMLVAHPNDDAALHKRAKMKAKAGDTKGAIDDYTKAIKSLSTASLLIERANLYDKLGQKDLARRDRQQAERD